MEYIKVLKKLREEHNLTQKDMSNILDISRGLYSQYEIADKIIPIYQLNKLSIYFNVSMDYLLRLNETKQYKNSKKDINNEEFIKRLKEFRKENKITQEKLAQNLNTSHSVISSYEKGKTFILTSFLYAICKKYQISADYLLGKIDEPKYLK